MSNDMVPSLAPALCAMGKKQQTLSEIISRPSLIQVERFQTFRETPIQENGAMDSAIAKQHDDTQIIAWAMDSRSRIRVFFDVEATNRIEKATGERVTSYLRSLVYLRDYKFVILPPSTSPSTKKDYHTSRHRHHPELVLYVYDWQKYIGSRDDPLYHEEATYLLSNFAQYTADGTDGRVPPGYGVAADEPIWRKQENEAMVYLKNQWTAVRTTETTGTSPIAEPPGPAVIETAYRDVLLSILQAGMSEDQEQVLQGITVFGINPLQELDVMEIEKVLLDNGVNVIPEPALPKETVPPVEQPARAVSRRRACRKSTGRKLPRTNKSPSIALPSALSPPPATQPPTTQAIEYSDSVEPRSRVSAKGDPLRVYGSADRDTEQIQDGAFKKRKMVDFTACASPQNHMVRDTRQENTSDFPRSPMRVQKTRTTDNSGNAGLPPSGEKGSSPHLSSPQINGLVTQLPLSSLDPDDDGASSPRAPVPSTWTGENVQRKLEGDAVLTKDKIEQEDVDMNGDRPSTPAAISAGKQLRRYLWELDDDEDGLREEDVRSYVFQQP